MCPFIPKKVAAEDTSSGRNLLPQTRATLACERTLPEGGTSGVGHESGSSVLGDKITRKFVQVVRVRCRNRQLRIFQAGDLARSCTQQHLFVFVLGRRI